MMRKTLSIILALIFIISSVFILSSCSSVKKFEEKESPVSGLICISRQNNFIDGYVLDQYILYDPETYVMYSVISGNNGTAMSVLYNSDGTLKLYTPTQIEVGE